MSTSPENTNPIDPAMLADFTPEDLEDFTPEQLAMIVKARQRRRAKSANGNSSGDHNSSKAHDPVGVVDADDPILTLDALHALSGQRHVITPASIKPADISVNDIVQVQIPLSGGKPRWTDRTKPVPPFNDDHVVYFVHTSVVNDLKLWGKFLQMVTRAFAPAPARHDIIVTGRHTDEQVGAALRAVAVFNNLPLLNYPHRIPEILISPTGEASFVRFPDGDGPELVPYNSSTMWQYLVNRCARFFQITKKSQKPVEHPIHHISQSVIDTIRRNPRGIAHMVDGIVTVPVLRPNGTVLTTPGYDPQTGIIYHPDPKLYIPDILLHPDQAAIIAARELVLEVIHDFPFADSASRANQVALMFTPIIRSAIDGVVPVALINATNAGSGKSYLAHVVSIVATGHTAEIKAVPSNEEEMERAITGLLMKDNRKIICLDNLNRALDSGKLCAAVTSPRWTDRIIRSSNMCDIPNLATWIFTGNNIQLGGDMPRRCYLVNLRPEPNPEKRDTSRFRHHPLFPWVERERGRIIAAMLTLARAWYTAGRPAPARPARLGGFETWVETVQGIVDYSGIPDCLGNLHTISGVMDDEGLEWERFLLIVREWSGGKPFLTKDLVTAIDVQAELRNAVPAGITAAVGDADACSRVLGASSRNAKDGIMDSQTCIS